MKPLKLLLVEDEAAIRDMIRFALSGAELELIDTDCVTAAMEKIGTTAPDVILLDWMLPGKSGIDFIKWLKQQEALKHIPIIMLTAKAEEDSKVKALTTGADDYMTKPFSIAELKARIKAVSRRGPLLPPKHEIHIDQLTLNIDKHSAHIANEKLPLSPIEYKLLHFLVTHPDRAYTREQLLSHVWGIYSDVTDRTVDAVVKRLRQKLKTHGYDHTIQTIRGTGYTFVRATHG